jgi:hypothetical protein
MKDAGGSALVRAAFDGDHSEVISLIANGIDVNAAAGVRGITALHAASFKNHLDIVAALCDRGANINLRDRQHWNALTIAASKDFTAIVRLLIMRGADTTDTTKVNGLPLSSLLGSSASIKVPLTEEEKRARMIEIRAVKAEYDSKHHGCSSCFGSLSAVSTQPADFVERSITPIAAELTMASLVRVAPENLQHQHHKCLLLQCLQRVVLQCLLQVHQQ